MARLRVEGVMEDDVPNHKSFNNVAYAFANLPPVPSGLS